MVPKNAQKPPNFKRLLVPKRAHLHWAQDQGVAPAAGSVEFLWFKMAGTGVPHIVLHVLCSTRTSGGNFRPQKSVLSKLAVLKICLK